MPTRAALLLLLATLAGCQAGNPYTADRLPYPPPPADPASAPAADPGSYPPPARSFALHSHWQWLEPVDEQLAGIVSGELDQRGLRPASALSPATLGLRVQQSSATRQRLVYDDPWLGVGYGHFHRHYGYWGGAPFPLVHTVTYRVVEVQMEFFDAASGEPLWSGAGTAELAGSGTSEALRRAIRRALDGFPPP